MTPVVCRGVVIGRCQRSDNEPFSWYRGRIIRTIHVKHNGVIRKKVASIRYKNGAYVVRNLWHAEHLPGFVSTND